MWTGLTLIQLAPRRPAAYVESMAFTTTPSCPAASAAAETCSAAAGSAVISPGMRCAGRDARRAPRGAARSGSSMRSRPSTCSTSKNHGCSTVSRAPSAPNRAIVSWKGRGTSFSSRARVSPSRITACTGIRRTISTTSGSRCVMSARLRVNTQTSSPARCTWMRAPSSLYSTDASPTVAIASAALAAVPASIGMIARPTTSPTASSSSAVPVIASTAVSARSPESIAARRTLAASRPEARTIASRSTPSSAPVRSSPTITRARKSHSAAGRPPGEAWSVALRVADRPGAGCRGQRFERGVDVARSSGSARRRARPRGVAMPRQPTPIRPCRGLAVRRPTAGANSSGSSALRSSASASIFASRERVAVTASTVSTTRASSMVSSPRGRGSASPSRTGRCAGGR